MLYSLEVFPAIQSIPPFRSNVNQLEILCLLVRQLTLRPFAGAGWREVHTPSFLRVLDQLKCLRVLVLRFLTFSSLCGDGERGHDKLPTIDGQLKLDRFETQLVNFQDNMTFNAIFSVYSSIKILDLERCFGQAKSWGDSDDASLSATSNLNPPSLSVSELKFTIHGEPADVYLINSLHSVLHTSAQNLQTLHTRVHPVLAHSNPIHPFLSELGTSVYSLRFEAHDPYLKGRASIGSPHRGPESFFSSLNLSSFPSLTTVTIYFGKYLFNSDFEWQANLRFLSLISNHPYIRHIAIIVYNPPGYGPAGGDASQSWLQCPEWNDLDQSLSKFPNLLFIELAFIFRNDPRVDDVKQYLLSREDLWIVQNGVLRFSSEMAEKDRITKAYYRPPW